MSVDYLNSSIQEQVNKLYELYGFTCVESKNDYSIYSYSSGYFNNTEIIEYSSNPEIPKKKESFESIGYSVRQKKYSSLEELHKSLFCGFFSIKRVQKSLKRDYDSFCKLQSKKLYHSEYEYVAPSFYWNNKQVNTGLVEMISDQLGKSGAQLIILEAAAGYGKTCSSYEMLRGFAEAEDLSVTPIFIELAKNRKAALFRYVLLDEIDRKFPHLSSQLVIQEIQNGSVPLIIDGFDELISRSNKGMQTESDNNDDAQTMLDTIASTELH